MLSAMIVELLFLKGEECRSLDDFHRLFHQHFGLPLSPESYDVSGAADLFKLPEVRKVATVSEMGS